MGAGSYMEFSVTYFKTLPEAMYNAKIGHYNLGPNVLKNEDLKKFQKTGHF
jgi:hypothetical protein